MSNLSDIGFPVAGEQDVNEILMSALTRVSELSCPPFGSYYRHADPSGAELFIQGNADQELVGFNPAFAEGSRVRLILLRSLERDTSDLDGGFVCRHLEGGPTFVFDTPDFRRYKGISFPREIEAELTAFASADLAVAGSSDISQEEVVSFGIESISVVSEEDASSKIPPQAHVRIVASVSDSELRENELTRASFALIDAEAGPFNIRIASDPKLFDKLPESGDRISGSFWLSGKLLED
jgi:hypothetical protein